MARGKVILFCNSSLQELACLGEAYGQEALLIDMHSRSPHALPGDWLSRFQALSPSMLRNYLISPDRRVGVLNLPETPASVPARSLFEMTTSTYAWIFVVGSHDLSANEQPLLEAADAVVWSQSEDKLSESYSQFLSQITRLHYPPSFVHIVRREELSELPDRLDRHPELFRPVTTQSPAALEVIEQVKDHVQSDLVKALAYRSVPAGEKAKETVEARLAEDASLPSSPVAREMIVERVLQDMLGFGPLEPLLRDPGVSEVMVNGPHSVYVEKSGRLVATEIRFASDQQLRTVIDRIVSPLGRRVDESAPLCDARLPDGSRVNVVLPPLSLDGPVLTIRKFSTRALGLRELESLGSLSADMHSFLSKAVRARKNIVVSGGTGSGKTTLLNALSGMIPDEERIVTIEDAAELKLQKPHVVRLESRPPSAEGSGAIPIRRLVMNALRMRPDRIVIGECRGGEALDMLQAMNTGHDGSMTTLHANTPRDALGRLETLVLMSGVELPVKVVREQIRSAVNVIVQQARLSDGSRKVTSITEITGMEGDILTTQELFVFRDGCFHSTGVHSEVG